MSKQDDLWRLDRLLLARHRCISIVTNEEEHALNLISDAAMGAGCPLLRWSVIDGLRDGLIQDGRHVEETDNPAAALYHLSRQNERLICAMLDLTDHLTDGRVLRAMRDVLRKLERTEGHLVLVDHSDNLPPVIRSVATRFEVSMPAEDELEQIVRRTVQSVHRDKPIEVEISKAELKSIIRNLRGLTRSQSRQVILDAIMDDRRFDIKDLPLILARKREMVSTGGVLEFVDTPAEIDEIGGMNRLKEWLSNRRLSTDDKAEAFGLTPPRGVLMLGVQGAGKSLCAKAIATAWKRPLVRLDPGVLYDRYVGESERRLRDALKQAEAMAPVVLWIDEIEKAFASAASRSTDGGLSQRMFGSLLTWMQEHKAPVFLVATANDIEALPPELLRKGRFDEIFFVDLPEAQAREQIFKIHLSKRNREPKHFDMAALVDVSKGYSGAEIEQAIIAALHGAYAHNAKLDTDRLVTSIKLSPPLSVTMRERIDALRAWAKGRCVPAD